MVCGYEMAEKANTTLVMREDTGLSQRLRVRQGDITPLRKQAARPGGFAIRRSPSIRIFNPQHPYTLMYSSD